MIALQLRPDSKNTYPLNGLLLRGASVGGWLRELQLMQLSLEVVDLYPVPGTTANSVGACLVVLHDSGSSLDRHLTGRHELCQQLRPNIFLPEKAALYPQLSDSELEKKFSAAMHLIHPVYGFAELEGPIDLTAYIALPAPKAWVVTRPSKGVFTPQRITGFSVEVNPETSLAQLEETIFPKPKPMPDEQLSIYEQLKLKWYRLFLKRCQHPAEGAITQRTHWWQKMSDLLKGIVNTQKIEQAFLEDFEELEHRNQKELDKLLEMLRRNPSEALKYAPPLDANGSARGKPGSLFVLSRLWNSLAWSATPKKTSGGNTTLGDGFFKLQRQYALTAEQLVRQKKFHDAAFIQMKLLKNPYYAAEILEKGGYYEEAATIYLTHTNNKLKAAQCYEKGNMTLNAVALYKELNEEEKVGDLYSCIGKHREATTYYQAAVDRLSVLGKYVDAANICTNKLNDRTQAQTLLKKGWQQQVDPANCLVLYFDHFSDDQQLLTEIQRISTEDLSATNCSVFLQALNKPYIHNKALSDDLREIAYSVVAEHLPQNPYLSASLRLFNPADKQLSKDIMRYKTKRLK